MIHVIRNNPLHSFGFGLCGTVARCTAVLRHPQNSRSTSSRRLRHIVRIKILFLYSLIMSERSALPIKKALMQMQTLIELMTVRFSSEGREQRPNGPVK